MIFDGEMSLPAADWDCIHSLQALVALLLEGTCRMESTCSFIVHHNFQDTNMEMSLISNRLQVCCLVNRKSSLIFSTFLAAQIGPVFGSLGFVPSVL